MTKNEEHQDGVFGARLILQSQTDFDVAIKDYSGLYKVTIEFSDKSYSSESTWMFYGRYILITDLTLWAGIYLHI